MTDTRPIRVALYARVSTSNHGQDVTLQTRELKEFIEHRGWQFAGEYVDLGISGSRNGGPSWPQIARQLGCGVGTAYRAFLNLSKKPKDETPSSAIVPRL